MDYKSLDKLLKQYTEDELLYREYYYLKNNHASLDCFISKLDSNFIIDKNLLIPEVNDFFSFISEHNDTFNKKLEYTVLVLKHYRFTPEFQHKHDFFEIVYVYSGNCTQNINGDSITLSEGDICILPPGVSHSIGVFDDSIIVNIIIRRSTFSDTFLEVLSNENILSSFFTKILYTNSYNNYLIFRNNNLSCINVINNIIMESFENKKYSNKVLDNLIMIFFAYLLRDEDNIVELPNELQKISNNISSILTYIQSNFKTVTLNELSNKFHFSVPYLSKIIKTSTGHNFKEMLQIIKLNKAIELLSTSTLRICDISENLGYENNTHFIRTFKKSYGIPPGEYRKKLKKQ